MIDKHDIRKVDNTLTLSDMPKVYAPWERSDKPHGGYTADNEILEGMNWVFDNENTIAVEKLDGTNVSIIVQGGEITHVFNRTNRVQISPWSSNRILQGIREAHERGYIPVKNGQWFGELIGPKINGNRHNIDYYLWYPFERAKQRLRYKSWNKYEPTREGISGWFKDHLFSLFHMHENGVSIEGGSVSSGTYCEGIIVVHKDGRLAKIRRDMFDWYHKND